MPVTRLHRRARYLCNWALHNHISIDSFVKEMSQYQGAGAILPPNGSARTSELLPTGTAVLQMPTQSLPVMVQAPTVQITPTSQLPSAQVAAWPPTVPLLQPTLSILTTASSGEQLTLSLQSVPITQPQALLLSVGSCQQPSQPFQLSQPSLPQPAGVVDHMVKNDSKGTLQPLLHSAPSIQLPHPVSRSTESALHVQHTRL